MRDGKGRPQGKCWETAVAAEQETCWWEMTSCRSVRRVQKNGAGTNTQEVSIQYSAQKKMKVGENSPNETASRGEIPGNCY